MFLLSSNHHSFHLCILIHLYFFSLHLALVMKLALCLAHGRRFGSFIVTSARRSGLRGWYFGVGQEFFP